MSIFASNASSFIIKAAGGTGARGHTVSSGTLGFRSQELLQLGTVCANEDRERPGSAPMIVLHNLYDFVWMMVEMIEAVSQ